MLLEENIRQKYPNIVGIVVMKNNETVYERYWNGCDQDSSVHVFSVTKSIVSLLIGIALDKGYIQSIQQKILDFFPEYTPKRGERTLRKITIKDILTMTVPYKYNYHPYTKYFSSKDWVKFSLDVAGGKGKIGEFRYAPLVGPDILSGILVKTAGRSALDFARDYLFGPLGISVEKSITFASKEEQMAFYQAKDVNGWVADQKGTNAAAWGLTLSAQDMAKIGQLYLNNGSWNGARLVSEKWLKESTSVHSYWKEKMLFYGYLWWVLDKEGTRFAAMGDGGNVIYVDREKKLVVAITSFFAPRVTDRIEFIQNKLIPALTTSERR